MFYYSKRSKYLIISNFKVVIDLYVWPFYGNIQIPFRFCAVNTLKIFKTNSQSYQKYRVTLGFDYYIVRRLTAPHVKLYEINKLLF